MINMLIDDMMERSQKDYELGYITPAVFLVSKDNIAMYPTRLIDILPTNKPIFLKQFRGMLEDCKPVETLILFATSFNGCDTADKTDRTKEFAFMFANEKDRQTIYYSKLKNQRMHAWHKLGVRDNVRYETWLGGNFAFLYGLGTIMEGKKQG